MLFTPATAVLGLATFAVADQGFARINRNLLRNGVSGTGTASVYAHLGSAAASSSAVPIAPESSVSASAAPEASASSAAPEEEESSPAAPPAATTGSPQHNVGLTALTLSGNEIDTKRDILAGLIGSDSSDSSSGLGGLTGMVPLDSLTGLAGGLPVLGSLTGSNKAASVAPVAASTGSSSGLGSSLPLGL
ncbi:hypothetical protein RQP46_005587 [Phenoliferia psychrophenolica]